MTSKKSQTRTSILALMPSPTKPKHHKTIIIGNELNQTELEILKKNPRRRFFNEMDLLIEGTRDIKFFSQLRDTNGPEIHENCCKYLGHHFLKGQNVLFSIGELGTQFYVILKGSVGIYLWIDAESWDALELRKEDPWLKWIDEKFPPRGLRCLKEVKTLLAGDSFGELALLDKKKLKPRQATVISKEDTDLCYLEREHFLQILYRSQEEKFQGNINFFMEIPMFKEISFNVARRIYFLTDLKVFNFNEYAYKEGEPADYFFIIKKGQFEVSKKINMQKPKKEVDYFGLYRKIKPVNKVFELCILGEREVFGEIELMNEGKNREYTIRCKKEKSEAFFIQAKDFKLHLKEDPTIGNYLRQRVNSLTKVYESRINYSMLNMAHEKELLTSPSHLKEKINNNDLLSSVLLSEERSSIMIDQSQSFIGKGAERSQNFQLNSSRRLTELPVINNNDQSMKTRETENDDISLIGPYTDRGEQRGSLEDSMNRGEGYSIRTAAVRSNKRPLPELNLNDSLSINMKGSNNNDLSTSWLYKNLSDKVEKEKRFKNTEEKSKEKSKLQLVLKDYVSEMKERYEMIQGLMNRKILAVNDRSEVQRNHLLNMYSGEHSDSRLKENTILIRKKVLSLGNLHGLEGRMMNEIKSPKDSLDPELRKRKQILLDSKFLDAERNEIEAIRKQIRCVLPNKT